VQQRQQWLNVMVWAAAADGHGLMLNGQWWWRREV
jgi:hypothetical protein